MKLTFDKQAFQIDDRDAFMISGEFHYFRVPHTDWKRRMELFKEAGGNTIATYVPWLIHEPEEGKILFGDTPQRDLAKFLDTAKEVGLQVTLRPGPYQYSELVNDGLPDWLLQTYPEVCATRPDGSPLRRCSISYLHPKFLEKARIYYKAFAEVVRPYLNDPITMIQVDNEAMGIHIWFGGLDYNATTMGFGEENGRYPKYLKKVYCDIETLNKAYGTEFAAFTDIPAPQGLNRANPAHARRLRDYQLFYFETVAEYLTLLRSWLHEEGLQTAVCHNASGPMMPPMFRHTVDAMGDKFLLGVDHYYTLGQSWAQNNPTPQAFIRCFASLERLRLLGMPPAVLEMPGGSPSDTPPILYEDLLAWYTAHVAYGMKGVNYYVYTGGPNFPGTGSTADIYDYNALVHADGSLNKTYDAAKEIGLFMQKNPWLQRAKRRTSVQVGFEWESMYAERYDHNSVPLSANTFVGFTERGILHTLLSTRYAPELIALDRELDRKTPLIVPCPSVMSEAAQTKLVAFVKQGGKLFLFGAMPHLNEKYEPCTVLRDYCGITELGEAHATAHPIRMANGRNVYQMTRVQAMDSVPENTVCIATDTDTEKPIGFRKEDGGSLTWIGVYWHMVLYSQAEMLEDLLEEAGAIPAVQSSNRTLFTSLQEGENGKKMLFILNLFSGKQSTDITVWGKRSPPFSRNI